MTEEYKNRCGTMAHHYRLAARDEVYQANRREIEKYCEAMRSPRKLELVTIPVVVHVLYKEASENISEAQIKSQIEILNQDFRMKNDDLANVPKAFEDLSADAHIEFKLATRDPQGQKTNGICRKETVFDDFAYEDFDLIATISPAWDRDSYLNIWVCTLSGGLLGFAQFPGGPADTDGVVVRNLSFGNTGIVEGPYDLGRTATHEIGHWLNLNHIWGDDGVACKGSDSVSDTPNQAGANVGKPTFPHISCSNEPHGDMFMNYMDYVDDDAMFMFSKGQIARMRKTLDGARTKLKDSKGLRPVTTERVELTLLPGDHKENIPKAVEVGCPVTKHFDGVFWVEEK